MSGRKKQIFVRGVSEMGRPTPSATLPELLKRHPHAKQMLGILGEAEAQLAVIIGLDRNQVALQVTLEELASRND